MDNTTLPKDMYLVPVDDFNNYTSGTLHPVTKEHLDDILKHFETIILGTVGAGDRGFMTMWACFQERLNVNYQDLANAYQMLTKDSYYTLYDRESNLRHLWEQYEELWQIRHFKTVENYYKYKAEKAKDRYKPMIAEFNEKWGIKNES